jgi:exodeoxyribonuclease VII small subunit
VPAAADKPESGAADVAAPDVSGLSYEQARDELIRVVTELEQGAATLEDSLALWERGEALAKRCEEWLLGAKERLDKARAATGAASSATSSATGSSGTGDRGDAGS